MYIKDFSCSMFMDTDGRLQETQIIKSPDLLMTHFTGKAATKKIGAYLVPGLPVEVHIHGVRDIDFSSKDFFDLAKVNEYAKAEGLMYLPCIFLRQDNVDRFVDFMKEFHRNKQQGRLEHIIGISLEGPLLGSYGGTPSQGTWAPTKQDWMKIVNCGALGLKYIVLSPDVYTESSSLYDSLHATDTSLEWIVSTMLEADICISIGHFHKKNPWASGQCIDEILKISKRYHPVHSANRIMVDHFFNDMPSQILYSWRTPESQRRRIGEIEQLKLEEWTLENVVQRLGPVPGKIMNAANDGLLTICINFDGQHVDLEVCKRILELVDHRSVCMMTDRLETNKFGDNSVIKSSNSLWYKEDGVVAAGSSTIDKQMNNLRNIGLEESVIWRLCSFVPSSMFNLDFGAMTGAHRYYSYVSLQRERHWFMEPALEPAIIQGG